MATITSKYNINDLVWVSYNHKYYKGRITDIESWDPKYGFLYKLYVDNKIIEYFEYSMFSCKEDVCTYIFVDNTCPELPEIQPS